jgi:nicotinamidase-related amidase
MSETKILIVVDMLNDFLKPDGKLYCGPTAEAIIPGVVDLVKKYKENKDVIIFLADAHDENDLEFKRFPEHCVAGTDGAELIDELNDLIRGDDYDYDNFEILEKKRYSGFFETELEDALFFEDSDLVEVVGICTSICVMDTVGGLANRDLKINLYKDLVADFDPEMHEMALKRMENLYGVNMV